MYLSAEGDGLQVVGLWQPSMFLPQIFEEPVDRDSLLGGGALARYLSPALQERVARSPDLPGGGGRWDRPLRHEKGCQPGDHQEGQGSQRSR